MLRWKINDHVSNKTRSLINEEDSTACLLLPNAPSHLLHEPPVICPSFEDCSLLNLLSRVVSEVLQRPPLICTEDHIVRQHSTSPKHDYGQHQRSYSRLACDGCANLQTTCRSTCHWPNHGTRSRLSTSLHLRTFFIFFQLCPFLLFAPSSSYPTHLTLPYIVNTK